MKKGVVTNNFLSADAYRDAIDLGALQYVKYPGGLFFLRDCGDVRRLSFDVWDLSASPELDFPCVTALEIPRRSNTQIDALLDFWHKLGFTQILERVRLTRDASAPERMRDNAQSAGPAQPSDADAILALLRDCFDVVTGCLPSPRELESEIAGNSVFRALDGSFGVCGVLRARFGAVCEIQSLAVRGDVRRRGVASALYDAFALAHPDGKCRVWTGTDNAPALAFYGERGFTPDGMTSVVLCNR
jgi:GNAT superfamily N-acetyltransferase